MADVPTEGITFAIISTAPAAPILLEALCEELSKDQTPVKAKVLKKYADLPDMMGDGRVDVAWAPPLVALELEKRGAGRVVLCAMRGHRSVFSTALFVKATSGITTLSGLAGKRIAWVDKGSSAGYVVPRLKLAAEGIDLENFFGEETFRRTHEAVARAVLSGEADVGATYLSTDQETGEILGAGWLEVKARPDDVHILATAGPIPSDTIAVSATLDDKVAERVVGLLQSPNDACRDLIRGLLQADGFQPAGAGHLAGLRALLS